jgi:putative membrane protein
MLKDGIAQLKDGTEQLKSGSVELETGLNTLNENSKKIDTAIGSISDGTKDLLAGEQELSDGVDTFKAEIDEGIESSKTELESVDGLSEYISDPVEVDKEAYGEVKSYGYSFAPFFMSISLWVGALMVFIVIYYDPENRFKILGRKSEHRFTRLGLYVLIAILQALILGFLLKFALGFMPTNELLYYGSCVIVSLVFFSIMQFFIFNLKDVGKFIALILLILQLAASGGTFPIETIPSCFQAISPFMPMTYSIQLFKEALISIDTAILYKNLGVLIAIWLVFLTGSFIGDVVRILKEKKAKK